MIVIFIKVNKLEEKTYAQNRSEKEIELPLWSDWKARCHEKLIHESQSDSKKFRNAMAIKMLLWQKGM